MSRKAEGQEWCEADIVFFSHQFLMIMDSAEDLLIVMKKFIPVKQQNLCEDEPLRLRVFRS